MRRLFVLISLALVFAVPVPASAHTPSRPCAFTVDPGRGGPKHVFRITGRHMPEERNGGSLEVQVEILKVIHDDSGQRLKLQTLFWAFLIPGVHTFYFDYNEQIEGAPSRLAPGHYVVAAETPHQRGCHAVTGFDVVRDG